MKNVQIPQELFMKLLRYHLLDDDSCTEDVKKGLEQKMNTMVERELYTKSKTASVTGRTSLLNGKKSGTSAHLTCTITGRTSFSACTGGTTASLTFLTSFIMAEMNVSLCTVHGIFKRNVQIITKACTLCRTASFSAGTS